MRHITLVVLVVVFLLAAACPGEAASYVVQPGDTLWLVAQRYDTSVNAMVQANGLTNPEYIEVGQRLTIPEDVALHVVRPGETLWLIAQQYDTTTDAIARENGISQPDYIEVGAQLRIPTSGSSSVSHRFSASELDLLARLVHAESAGEPYAGQVAVAATILNRVESLRYPNTISGVIYQVVHGHYQYSPVMDGRINLAANQTARSAAQDALNGWDPSQGAIGFYNPMKATNTWVRQQPVTTAIGNHVFFR